MTVDDIDRLARKHEPLPGGSNLTAYGLYSKLCEVYTGYDSKKYTENEARELKSAAKNEYVDILGALALSDRREIELRDLRGKVNTQRKIIQNDAKKNATLGTLAAQANKSECEICKKFAKAWSGVG